MVEQSSLQPSADNSSDATANPAPHKWARYIPRDEEDAALRMASTELLVRAVLDIRKKLHRKQLAEILSVCIWQLSEAKPEHKHRTRYRSVAAQVKIEHENKCDSKTLRHDHVFERRLLIKSFEAAVDVEDKAEAERLLADAFAKAEVACTVTKDEHDKQLRNTGKCGWERYHLANIEIFDTLTGRRGVPNAGHGDTEPFLN